MGSLGSLVYDGHQESNPDTLKKAVSLKKELNDKYADKTDAAFTNNIEQFLSGMPDDLLKTWKATFPENKVHFGKSERK